MSKIQNVKITSQDEHYFSDELVGSEQPGELNPGEHRRIDKAWYLRQIVRTFSDEQKRQSLEFFGSLPPDPKTNIDAQTLEDCAATTTAEQALAQLASMAEDPCREVRNQVLISMSEICTDLFGHFCSQKK